MDNTPEGPSSPTGHGYTWPGQPGYMVDADPESAGLVRVEKPGWAIVLAGLGAVTAAASFFLGWFRTSTFLSDEYLTSQGKDSDEFFAKVVREWPTPFSVVDTVKETSGQGRSPYDPGAIATVVFPWLALILTVACCVLVVVAALGLRRKLLTAVARVSAVVLLVVTLGVIVLATFDLGFTKGGMDYGPEGPEAPNAAWTSWEIHPDAGFAVWLGGLLLLGIAAAMGPRITHRLPDGSQVSGPQTFNGQPFPSQYTGFSGAGPIVRVRTKVSAIVSAGIGAVICFAGYGFLPWGDDTTFSDIGEAARDYGFEDKPFTEAYFAWLGWAVLALVVVVLVILVLGRTVSGVNAAIMRPILALTTLAAGLAHAWALIDLGSDGAEFGVGAYAVGLGLFLTIVGALAPLDSSARMMVNPWANYPQQPPGQQSPPAMGGQPPRT